METWILGLLEQFGLFAVFFLILIENIFPPIPSELVLTFAGYMSTITSYSLIEMIIASTLGSVIGALLLYGIGYILKLERLLKLINKIGKYIRLSEADIQKACDFYRKYQTKAVFFCRMVPLLRSLISVPAGLFEMKMTPFLITTILGSTIWNTLLIIVGSIVGENRAIIFEVIDAYKYILVALVLVLVVAYFIYKKRKVNKS